MKANRTLIALAKRLYRELKSGNAVAKKLELSHSTTYRLLRVAGVRLPDRHGPEVQERKKKLHGATAKRAARDYQKGLSNQELCAKYGVGWWAIRTTVRDYGLTPRSRGGRYRVLSATQKGRIASLYKAGMTQMQAAVEIGCSQGVVSRVLKQADVVIRNPRARGSSHPSWKGGRHATSCGYIETYLNRDDPMWSMANSLGYVLEHRLAVARALGRPLSKHETVHHLDGNKANNELGNLQLRFGKHGVGIACRCADCGSTRIEPISLGTDVD